MTAMHLKRLRQLRAQKAAAPYIQYYDEFMWHGSTRLGSAGHTQNREDEDKTMKK